MLKWVKLTPPQILVFGFVFIILLGSFILMLPISLNPGTSITFIDALFTATSAACVTGLVVVDTSTQFSMFGQVVILILIQIGGLGFMTMAALLFFVVRKKITLKERLLLQETMRHSSLEGIVRLVRRALVFSITIELIGAILLSIRWSFDYELQQAIYFGIFHSISFFNNAGFDLFGQVSGPFSSISIYKNDIFINFIVLILIFSGGLGFIVLSELIDYPSDRKLSLHSKVVLYTSIFLIVVGAIVIFVFEFTNSRSLQPEGIGDKMLASLFQSNTTRSGGITTLDFSAFRQATQFFVIILMFIGASPGSAGGGIKTTSFAILIASIIAMIRGKEEVTIFRYRLARDLIMRAITFTLLSLFLVVFISMVLSTLEDKQFLVILFEVTSAFGTVGLSLGLTPQLTVIGKLVICVTMFLGRLGPITLAYALQPKQEKELYRYPEGKINVG
jgi:trk system potassium uptake protein TrkH